MATITTKETRAFNWANPGTLKVGDEIVSRSTKTEMRTGGGSVLLLGATPTASAV